MPGGRLTHDDRHHIADALANALDYTQIGRRLGRPASTIMREVTRNGGPDNYRADQAQQATHDRARRHRHTPTPPPPIPDTGHGRDPHAVQDFTESFTALLTQQGMPRMIARVLTCLYTTDTGTLTAADLATRLTVSPASISHAVTYLEHQGMLRRERTPGARRERYVVDEQIWLPSLLATVRMNDALAATAQRGADTLGTTTPAGARFRSSAELLQLVSAALTAVIDQWRHTMATGQPQPPTTDHR